MSFAGAHLEFPLSHFRTCPSVGAAVCTFAKSLMFAAPIRASALAFVKYKFAPSVKLAVVLLANLVSKSALSNASVIP